MRPIAILLVEDNPADIKLTEEALREVAVPSQLTVVQDGVEAMAFLQRERPYISASTPDLVLLDLNLPRMGGIEFLDAIFADSRLQQIPIVVLTGSVDREEQAELARRPIRRHIIKPSDIDEYFTAIQSVLGDLSMLRR